MARRRRILTRRVPRDWSPNPNYFDASAIFSIVCARVAADSRRELISRVHTRNAMDELKLLLTKSCMTLPKWKE